MLMITNEHLPLFIMGSINPYYDGPLSWDGHGCNVLTGIQVDLLDNDQGQLWFRARVKNSNNRAWTATASYAEGPIVAAENLLNKYKLDWKLNRGCSLNNGQTYVFTTS